MAHDKELVPINRYSKVNLKYSPIILTFPIYSTNQKNLLDKVQLTLQLKSQKNLNYIIHRAYIKQRYNERRGTAKTLTRAEVRGGGRKPWRQKGTGRARAGSNRSPLWKGGGVTFGPRPKVYKNKINRKEWQLSFRSLLLQKQNQITIIKHTELTSLKSKTNIIISKLKEFKINLALRTVIIVSEKNDILSKITQNIKTIKILYADQLNLKEILYAKQLLITTTSLKIIEQTYNNNN